MLNIIASLIIISIVAFIIIATIKKNKSAQDITQPPIKFAKKTNNHTYIEVPKDANITYQPLSSKKSTEDINDKYKKIIIEADTWAQRTITTAINAAKQGHGPFAALIVQIDNETKQVIRYWSTYNQVVATNDPTAHAEVQVIRQACSDLGTFELDNITAENSVLSQPGGSSYTVLYASCEPCPMCMAACYWAKIKSVIFTSIGADAELHANFADDTIAAEIDTPYAARKFMEVHYAPCQYNVDAFKVYAKQDCANKYGRNIQL